MPLASVTLDDKYTADSGRVYLSGVQALVRLPMMQRARDRTAGLNTGGFISGYRGSPLGGYDNALWRARTFLEQHNIHFQPGLNEDLAATSIWGSQQVNLFPGALVDGVFGIWYGKGPGVDRSTDALKHGNAAGSSRHGGVLVVAGDDHGCQSSTLPHQSEQVLQAAMIPILNPSTVQEYLDFGLHGFALSRFSGCWVGLKATAETVESSASVSIDPERVEIVRPAFAMPRGGLNIRWPDPPMEQERRLHGPKMAAVAAFVRANAIDRIVLDPKPARLGIITAGKAYLDVRQALDDLGLDDRRGRGTRHPPVQGRAHVAARSGARAALRRRPLRSARRRGEARLHRRPARARALQPRCSAPAACRRQVRRAGSATAAVRRRDLADAGGESPRRAPRAAG